jgi:hypothetical protein
MHNPAYDEGRPMHARKPWMMLFSWVGAASLFLLIIPVVALLILKCRQRQARNELFEYSQLNSQGTADERAPEVKSDIA